MNARHLLTIASAQHGEEHLLLAAVLSAREAGVPWSVIGAALGITPQAAERRFDGQAAS